MLHYEQCQDNNKQLFVVGEGVNAKTGGEPYLAGVITKIEGEDIYVKFPYGRYHNYEYKYDKSQLLPFTSQFINGKLNIIKKGTKPMPTQRKAILEYETRLLRYLNQ
ncbi:unnamed protein product [Macrosiphum euphorbiae]|uniref:Uncharacterized protein n=1 Tax=Macrosiphum euphorbiae TaxID=13131 RepID=A0AAV0WA19_9HEMI|nr:unnamed protein product [Macrosiphum euphorbiae]